MATTREILEPRWGDTNKTSVIVKFRYTDDDNATREVKAVITNTDGSNPDWTEVMSTFTTEQIDTNTQDRLDSIVKIQAERDEARLRDRERREQERLFDVKLNIFENPHISNSDDTDRKREIRRSSSETDVTFAALDLMIHDAFKRAGIDLPAANTTWTTSE